MSSQLYEKYNPRIMVDQHYLIHTDIGSMTDVYQGSNTCYKN